MLIAVHYAEIGLKGRNRPRFERQLERQIRRALARFGPVRIRNPFGRLLVELPDDAAWPGVSEALRATFGIAYFSRATRTEPEPDAIGRAVDALVDSHAFRSFGVRARRSEKRHPFTSSDLARELGARVQARTGAAVDLGNPDLWIEIHVLTREAILLHERVPGPGGMPVGSAGRALSLISGGIDSPVASWMLLKRGCTLHYAHFHSAPYTSRASQAKVRDLVMRLARHSGPARLSLVPFGELQRQLVSQAPAQPRIVLYRRFMLRVAERLAERHDALALVTGESLGQVSSQTLGNLDTIDRAATLPVLRPLIGLDKAEIIRIAESIGTYEISIEPDEDCCSFLMPRQAATWTRPQPIEAVERTLDVKGMVDACLERVIEEEIEPSE